MNLSKSYEFFKPEMLKGRVHIIGCGSVGSTLAENLARFGVPSMVLYDFDKVEAHNIVNQMFKESDIGRLKVEALADIVHAVNPDCDIKIVDTGWTGQKLSGYVFLCCDGIELRKQIASEHLNNSYVKGMFDFRTRLTDAQHYAADWSIKQSRDNFISTMNFSHEEAKEETPVSACGVQLSVATTIRTIVAFGVNNFVNFVKGERLSPMILADAFSFAVTAL